MSSTYAQLLEILDDGRWHGVTDLATVTRYPDEWARELSHEGHLVDVGDDGTPVVRLRPDAETASVH